jgi:tetratricopeptide (TPR) repeat protein
MKIKLLTILFGINLTFMGIVVVWWTIIPAHQARVASRVFQYILAGKTEAIPQSIFSPSYVQPELRNAYLDTVFDLYKEGKKDVALTLLPDARARMQEAVDQGSVYTRYLLSLAKAYNLSADNTNDSELYEQANKYYAQALTFSPRSPAITYAYGMSLVNQGKKEEGIHILEDLLAANTKISESHYYLALAYIKTDPKYYNRALDELEETLRIEPDFDDVGMKALYAKLFQHYYSVKDKERFMRVAQRLVMLDPVQQDMYFKIMQYVSRHNTLPLINISQ